MRERVTLDRQARLIWSFSPGFVDAYFPQHRTTSQGTFAPRGPRERGAIVDDEKGEVERRALNLVAA
jgi:hypothetical protein